MKSACFAMWSIGLAAACPLVSLLCVASLVAADPPPPPTVPDDLDPHVVTAAAGVHIELVREHPDIVTPTGIDVAANGDVWVVSSHTHHRPAVYEGPTHDEVVVFDARGTRRVWCSRTKLTMGLLLDPTRKHGTAASGAGASDGDGWVYLAERSRILRLRDADGDGQADVEEPVVTLDTVTDYPHNGLAGMAWHPDGDLVFSLGENFGKDWTLTGRDGAALTGRGEGGVFRCSPEGRGLRRVARGFWNPYGITVLPDGSIFAVDNDPGYRPPCRLLEVVERGDYGFQWAYGSSPVHPFVAWNGELRGTLGMIHSVGEGPCSVVPYGDTLVVPSWSQHRIDAFRMSRHGAGYVAQRQELVRGGDHFRPSGTARGPDGVLWCIDWVFSSYTLHRRGRLWKITIDPSQTNWLAPRWPAENEETRLTKSLRDPVTRPTTASLLEQVRSTDPMLADAALAALSRDTAAKGTDYLAATVGEERLWRLVAARKAGLEDARWVRAVHGDAEGDVLFECLRWIADGVLVEFAPWVDSVLARPDLDYRCFEAALATANTLAGNPGAGVTDANALLARLDDPATPPRLKGYLVRLLPPDDSGLSKERVAGLMALGDDDLTRELVRSLALGGGAARDVLTAIATDASRPSDLRADAVAGLAGSDDSETLAVLRRLAAVESGAVRSESLRSLRGRPLDTGSTVDQPPSTSAGRDPEDRDLVEALSAPDAVRTGRPAVDDTAAWLARIAAAPGKADIAAGRRIFFHAKVGQCANCHRHGGRGNVVGPDLTLVGRQSDRAGLLRSILEPSREVAPQYRAHVLSLADGTSFTGILLMSSNTEIYRDLTGGRRTLRPEEIDEVTELSTSVMPAGLPLGLTDGELRDLLAFLESSR